jgi:hypothetical protein
MCQGNKMAILAEPVHHCQDDGLAPYARKSFDKVQGNVRSHPLRNWQWHQKTRRVQML